MRRWPRLVSAPTAAAMSTVSSPATMTSAYLASSARRSAGAWATVIPIERAGRGEIESPADHRDRRRRRPALPEVTPQLLRPGGLVLLLADRGRADQDDVAQRAEQREDPPVGSGGNALREAVQRR